MAEQTNIPNFFLVGGQKCASTWIYRCLKEHPEIFVAATDEIHYFDINFRRGKSWYNKYFENYRGQKAAGDTTSSYMRDRCVPRRIFEFNREAKIIFSLRNPIERAFSHYWHEKKKGKIGFEFGEVFENYDLYENWIVTGFYCQHLTRFYEYFKNDQILILLYDDLKNDAYSFLRRIFGFLEVDTEFVPSVIEKKINAAWHHPNRRDNKSLYYRFLRLMHRALRQRAFRRLSENYRRVRNMPIDYNQRSSEYYDIGIATDVREQLRAIYFFENEELSKVTGLDLSRWG